MGKDEKTVKDRDMEVKALFLGPKSENRDYFVDTLDFLMDEHLFWRRDFHPEDKEVLDPKEMRSKSFQNTLDRTTEVLLELSSRLKTSSDPWFSLRYLGHMNSDTLMVANLAYMATILYNPNNVAYESSVATSQMELEAGMDMATMLGYDPQTTWGHITTDGTVANYEAVWLARNLKSFPLAVKKVMPELVGNMDDWQLLNLPPSKILDLITSVEEKGDFEKVRQESARGVGASEGKLGVLLVPQSKHYSWVKAADVLGIGQKNLIEVEVDDDYHMDIDVLKNIVDDHVQRKVPILGVVGVAGTTEEGAIDKLAEIAALRNEYEKEGISFYLHWDAAYGGYSRSLYLDENGEFMEYETLKKRVFKEGVFDDDTNYPSKLLYDSYKAFGEADSITIDPHKMGYIPYSAGGIALKDKKILDLISYVAAYVFEKGQDEADLLGSSIMEGSKSGAAAAAVWASHQAIPLNITGYGQIMGRSIQAARILTRKIKSIDTLPIGDKKYVLEPLCLEPDFNIVCMAFNPEGNTDLAKMNKLNMDLYNQSSYTSGPMFSNTWITSHTVLSTRDYGNAPLSFVERLGIPEDEWNKVQSVTVIRICTLNPFMAHYPDQEGLWEGYLKIWEDKIQSIDG
ncbi:pyridoxal phosphate-dependent decarboxylase family protein [Methanobacterium ferruginis]|uniref:pyridoxal phosphate-dependent decarboxylase family protein n=1 Tax=Methanobacterium ferruginis TaxID=710191 RepID=UPI0025730993|nr:pyridoxal-dependent decarboxylase [Methanobacterium ferruginis]BDZ67234.1 tyrosine decarboxylase [Methanobacterium ferruginis]